MELTVTAFNQFGAPQKHSRKQVLLVVFQYRRLVHAFCIAKVHDPAPALQHHLSKMHLFKY